MTMSNQGCADLLNEALKYCSLGKPESRGGGNYQTFWYGRDEVSIVGGDIGKFDEVINKIFSDEAEKKISRKSFVNIVAGRLYAKLKENISFSEADGQSFKAEIKKIPVEVYRVFREFKGATISGREAPLKMGRFTFYDWESHRSLIEEAHKGKPDDMWLGSAHHLLVECSIEAGDSERALEFGDLAFARLEGIIRFMIGSRQNGFEIGILDYSGLQKSQHYILQDGYLTMGIRSKGAIQTLPLHHDFFSQPAKNFQRLIDMEVGRVTPLERKILQSVGWIGQALVEANPASAFIKAATALEVLFSSNERGVITASIMAKIAESCAQILGDSTEICLEVERSVKRLYGVRSAVVHSGKEDVNSEDLDLFIHYARQVILNILMYDDYEGLKTIESLQAYLQAKKYTFVQA